MEKIESIEQYVKPIIDAMQELEEIGGPDYHEYMLCMRRLIDECTTRMMNAAANKS